MTAAHRPQDAGSSETTSADSKHTNRPSHVGPRAHDASAVEFSDEQNADRSRAAPKWEYHVIMRELHNAFWTVEMTEEVADLGRRGWELVAAYPVDMEISIASPSTHRAVELRERWVFKRRL